jgi:hypothetical protein
MFGTSRFRFFLVAIVLLSPAAYAQDTPITGARFTVVEKSEPALTVTLENLRDAPLVVWEIATVREGSSRPITTYSFYRTASRQYGPDDGPVPAHARRLQQIHVGNTGAAAAIMYLAVFADGYYEGVGADAYLQRQDSLGNVERAKVPGPLQRSGDVPSVRLTSAPSTTSKLYGVIENLRDVPVDAFGLQQYEDGRLRGGATSDFCGLRGAPIGSGPIQPGERREIPLSSQKNTDGSLPNVKLHFLIFEDSTIEGMADTSVATHCRASSR